MPVHVHCYIISVYVCAHLQIHSIRYAVYSIQYTVLIVRISSKMTGDESGVMVENNNNNGVGDGDIGDVCADSDVPTYPPIVNELITFAVSLLNNSTDPKLAEIFNWADILIMIS